VTREPDQLAKVRVVGWNPVVRSIVMSRDILDSFASAPSSSVLRCDGLPGFKTCHHFGFSGQTGHLASASAQRDWPVSPAGPSCAPPTCLLEAMGTEAFAERAPTRADGHRGEARNARRPSGS
jgi:hypothetical protein